MHAFSEVFPAAYMLQAAGVKRSRPCGPDTGSNSWQQMGLPCEDDWAEAYLGAESASTDTGVSSAPPPRPAPSTGWEVWWASIMPASNMLLMPTCAETVLFNTAITGLNCSVTAVGRPPTPEHSRPRLPRKLESVVSHVEQVLLNVAQTRRHLQGARQALRRLLTELCPGTSVAKQERFGKDIMKLACSARRGSEAQLQLCFRHDDASVWCAITPLQAILPLLEQQAVQWQPQQISRYFGQHMGAKLEATLPVPSVRCAFIDVYVDTAAKNGLHTIGFAWKLHCPDRCHIFPAAVLPYTTPGNSELVAEAAQVTLAILLNQVMTCMRSVQSQPDLIIAFTGLSCDTQWAHIAAGRSQCYSVLHCSPTHHITPRDLMCDPVPGAALPVSTFADITDIPQVCISDSEDCPVALQALAPPVAATGAASSWSSSEESESEQEDQSDSTTNVMPRGMYVSPAVRAIAELYGPDASLGHTIRPDPLHVLRGVAGYFLQFLHTYAKSIRRGSSLAKAIQGIVAGVPGFSSPAGRHSGLAARDFTPWLAGGGPVFTRVCEMLAILPLALAGITGWTARQAEPKASWLQREEMFIAVAVDINLLIVLCFSRGAFTDHDYNTAQNVVQHLDASISQLPVARVGAARELRMTTSTHKFLALREVLVCPSYASPMAGDCHRGELFMRSIRSDAADIGTWLPFAQRHSALLDAIWHRRKGAVPPTSSP